MPGSPERAVTSGRLWLATALMALIACGRPPDASPGESRPAPEARSPLATPGRPASAPLFASHLTIRGTSFVSHDDPFEWRGITAFRLAELVAQGREADAAAYLDWAASRRVTVVRVLLMAQHLFQLAPDQGLRAAPRLLELAAARGLHVELVALADTATLPVDLERHVTSVGAIARSHGNALVEIANEPWHPTQDRRLHDPAYVQSLAKVVPEVVPVALGSAEADPGYAAGDYATWHSPRGSGAEGWQHVLQLAEGAALIDRWKKPVVSDEPIGAAAAAIPGRRDDSPARFAAAGALSRLAGLGATFHYEGGLQASIPQGRELESFEAWAAGLDLLAALPPGGTFLDLQEARTRATADGYRDVFGREYAGELWVVGVGPSDGASVAFTGPWKLERTETADGVHVVRATRQRP